MEIVFLDADTVGKVDGLDKLKAFGQLIIYNLTKPEQTIERLQNADVVITNKVLLTRQVIEASSKLKLILIAATGINNVDLEAAQEHNIPVKNAAGYSTESVVDQTFASLFYLLRHLNYYDNYVKTGQYSQSPIFCHHSKPFFQLAGCRFGIIGLGAIGSAVAKVADAFGAEVVFNSTSGRNTQRAYKHLFLDELLETSDVVSIHAPLNEVTKDYITYKHIEKMRKHAYLINMGRGGIINEADLAKALDNNLIAGAATDVLTQEPPPSNHPLLTLKNTHKLYISPHNAWASVQARNVLVNHIYENLKSWLEKSK